jgi:hypothetical protein
LGPPEPRNRIRHLLYYETTEKKMTPEDINKFSMAIEEMVYMKDIPYIDAICLFCEQNNLETETAGKLVSGVLKAKIQIEAEELNFLKKSKTAKLPI